MKKANQATKHTVERGMSLMQKGLCQMGVCVVCDPQGMLYTGAWQIRGHFGSNSHKQSLKRREAERKTLELKDQHEKAA